MTDTTTTSLLDQVRSGHYVPVLTTEPAKTLIKSYVNTLYDSESQQQNVVDTPVQDKLAVALSAFNTFLQINVTGPVPDGLAQVEDEFTTAASSKTSKSKPLQQTRKLCFSSLDVDGVSVYQYIPSIELFGLARWVLSTQLGEEAEVKGLEGEPLEWLKLRVDVWHYKLITQPSLGPGSIFNKILQWCEVPSLQGKIEQGLEVVQGEVTGKDNKEMEVKWLVEKANVHIMLGQDVKAKEAIQKAAEVNKFQYMLSGALGKRTKFQEKATSQLVVLAKSSEEKKEDEETDAKPKAVELNDDTLLDDLQFTKGELGKHGETDDKTGLPAELKDLEPDAQPQLSPLDQIILLTEATLKDAFSPSDSLTSEEVLPFAVRVINDKSTNWQIYTQALLVRSRIEMHRSRTIERGVLQMQAVVDQVIVDTTAASPTSESNEKEEEKSDVPAIKISADGEVIEDKAAAASKPTSFFPAAKPEDSAPAHVRLQYIHALSSPPRWHLESELAYSWAGVGSLVSALEIFKRLRLWAEVALCLAANARHDDEDGRGAGGEEKGKAIVRWRLFHRTGVTTAEEDAEADDEVEKETLDISNFKEADFQGPERVPPPPNAPRLFCILGEMEDKPEHYERAWEISGQRYARAQKSLGEYWLSKQQIFKARDAYRKAVVVNRMSSELWNRLGDISLRLGDFAEAAESFSRGIAVADNLAGGEDARTWSNLGSALYSLYVERVKELKAEREAAALAAEPIKKSLSDEVLPDEDDTCIANPEQSQTDPSKRSPATLLSQSLAAYKRGASIANDNWRIWDNVITLASRVRPPAVSEIILALNHIIKIRASEDALDIAVLHLLLRECVFNKEVPIKEGVYDPPRGSQERAVCELLEKQVAPLITKRHELWKLLETARYWRRDYAGAIDAAERAFRAMVGIASAGSGLLPSAGMGEGNEKSWLVDPKAWDAFVTQVVEYVELLENFGEGVPEIGEKWKGKARLAIKSVQGKAREAWEGSEPWERLESLLEGYKRR
ncbi:hypothetical protein NEUTE1DRAFT_77909 [Neurospora tetrasperma FGSC 2508]|uniref:Uncharacterized protein n=1 Tax=Neurospora tetrasperma (strain FGSC 2508 / ATCC MYA-4615 / P0657) TaxID=510951 RepID=F8MG17_NEUT8|nr:uncharacterized protein NEUTE1DRAFT_77909 [Neurospora tetrasperma FGSC 2508]EGO58545.1 hypothetical protein NEUTE1DRAFT_77909 [Neurospora tetrasperma FGSC 2508]EGZ72610.1 hypothetical protein NEUTE2DRAFT_85076 [Neurospora tetrasperma FGSC 2509]